MSRGPRPRVSQLAFQGRVCIRRGQQSARAAVCHRSERPGEGEKSTYLTNEALSGGLILLKMRCRSASQSKPSYGANRAAGNFARSLWPGGGRMKAEAWIRYWCLTGSSHHAISAAGCSVSCSPLGPRTSVVEMRAVPISEFPSESSAGLIPLAASSSARRSLTKPRWSTNLNQTVRP